MVPFLYCLIGFLAIYMLFDTIESAGKIMEVSPPKLLILRYMAGRAALYLEWLLPACLLLASLYTMWNFCRHSEITAMRANGVSFLSITWPMLAVGAFVGILCGLNNEFYGPQAGEFADKLRDNKFLPLSVEIRKAVPFYNPVDRRVWIVNEVDINNPSKLKGVKVSISRKDGSKEYDVSSSSAEYLDGMWWFRAPQYQYYDEFNSLLPLPYPGLTNVSLRAMCGFTEKPQDFALQNKAFEFYTIRDRLRFLESHPNLPPDERASHQYDIYSKLASPAACFVITLFAIPAGVATGRQSVFKGILYAISMFFGYYLLVTLSMIFAKRGLLDPLLAAWIPCLVFSVAGLYLYYEQR